ncbi:MAG: penicillin-binding protein, partial [Bacteroidota bacterium]
GNRIARPIAEYFFRKVLADKKLGIEKDAKFVRPAELDNERMSADIVISDMDPSPGAEGDDQGVGTQDDYSDYGPADSIGPESKPVQDEEKKPKKDTGRTAAAAPAIKKEDDGVPIGSAAKEPEKKKRKLKKLFSKKDN